MRDRLITRNLRPGWVWEEGANSEGMLCFTDCWRNAVYYFSPPFYPVFPVALSGVHSRNTHSSMAARPTITLINNTLMNPRPLSPSIHRERQLQAWLLRGREKEDVSRSSQEQSLTPDSPEQEQTSVNERVKQEVLSIMLRASRVRRARFEKFWMPCWFARSGRCAD